MYNSAVILFMALKQHCQKTEIQNDFKINTVPPLKETKPNQILPTHQLYLLKN